MDDHLQSLRDALPRAKSRVRRCQRALERFDGGGNETDPAMPQIRKRLVEDLRKAKLIAEWAELALVNATLAMVVSEAD